MTKPLAHPLKSMVTDIWQRMRQVPGALESILAQAREHAQERATWAQERREFLASIEAQAAIIGVLLSRCEKLESTIDVMRKRCESLERDNDQQMLILGWRSRGQNERRVQ